MLQRGQAQPGRKITPLCKGPVTKSVWRMLVACCRKRNAATWDFPAGQRRDWERPVTPTSAIRGRKGAGIVMPRCNSEAMNMHLEEISFHVAPGTHAVLLLDQAGWHDSAELVVPDNITMLPLSPRCPELNPVENRLAVYARQLAVHAHHLRYEKQQRRGRQGQRGAFQSSALLPLPMREFSLASHGPGARRWAPSRSFA